jgi:hypothetical protein
MNEQDRREYRGRPPVQREQKTEDNVKTVTIEVKDPLA